MIGQTISHYKVLEKIGEGGMGEVFLAEDTSLDRKVALKFLPDFLQADVLAQKRFLREAKSAAALDHPYICHIHEVGETETGPFIAMEYVQGDTLQAKLSVGRVSVREVLKIASEASEALERAHQEGIVHRDLKPANIMLTPDGHVKVMDFGLAKRVVGEDGAEQDITSALTREGTTLGTLAYMSPEQLRGKSVDTRSDIFSFGIVLYELLSGVHPFRRETQAATGNAIMSEEPPSLLHYTEDVPELLQHTVKKMMAKDANQRYQSIHEAKVNLEELLEDTGKVPRVAQPVQKKLWLVALVLPLLAVLALSSFYWNLPSDRAIPTPTHRQITFEGNIGRASISPDGKFVAYIESESQRLFVKEMQSGAFVEVAQRAFSCPVWSQDSSTILYRGWFELGNALYALPRLGGEARLLIHSPSSVFCWGPDGSQIAVLKYVQQPDSEERVPEIKILKFPTGEVQKTISLGEEGWAMVMDWSPNQKFLALGLRDSVWTVSLDGRVSKKFVIDGSNLTSMQWGPESDAIYFDINQLEVGKISVSPETGEPLGSDWTPVLTGLRLLESFSLSRDTGKLLYVRSNLDTNIRLARLSSARSDSIPQIDQLTRGSREFKDLAVSPDGRQLAFIRYDPDTHNNVFVMPIGGGPAKQITYLRARSPVWSPDGTEIAFVNEGSGDTGQWTVWKIASEGGQPYEFKESRPQRGSRLVWSSGHQIIYWTKEASLMLLNPETEEERLLPVDRELYNNLSRFRFSPDGRYIAFNFGLEDEFGEYEFGLLIISLDNMGQRKLSTKQPVFTLRWANDPDWIFAYSHPPVMRPDRKDLVRIHSRTGETETMCVIPKNAKVHFDIDPDGRHFVYTIYEKQSDIWMVENFDPDLIPASE